MAFDLVPLGHASNSVDLRLPVFGDQTVKKLAPICLKMSSIEVIASQRKPLQLHASPGKTEFNREFLTCDNLRSRLARTLHGYNTPARFKRIITD